MKNKKSIIKNCNFRFKSILTVLAVLMLLVSVKTANAQYNISITGAAISSSTINTTRTPISSITTGSSFVYLIQYATQSNTQTGLNLVATIPLPTNLVPINTTTFSSSISFPATQVNSATYNSGNNTVTITFKTPLPAGSSGEIQLSLLYNNGITPNGYVPDLTTTVTQTTLNSPSPVTSNITNVTTIASNNFTMAKVKNSGGAVNDITIYKLNIGSTTSSTGSLNLISPVVTDVLAAGVEFVEATTFAGSNAPIYNSGNRTITWTWPATYNNNTGNFSTNYTGSAYVVVKYPNPPFALNANVSNTATLTGTATGEIGPTSKTGSVNFNLAAPTPNGKCTGGGITAATATWLSKHVLSGTSGNTFSNGWQNVGNTQLDSISLTYTIDKSVDVSTIGINRMTDGLGRNVNDTVVIRYKTNLYNAYRFWPSSPVIINANKTFNMSSLGLGVNEYVTDVNFVFYGDLPIGSSQSLNYSGAIRTALQGAKDGSNIIEGTTYLTNNPGDDGTIIFNNSTGYYIYNGSSTSYSGCGGSAEILKAQPVFNTLNKSNTTSSLRASDTASFSISVQLGGNVSAADVIITDTLNSKLIYIVGSGNILNSNNPNATAPITAIITNDSIINWNLGTLVVGKTYTINFKAQVKPGTLPNVIPNNAYVNSSNALFPSSKKGTTSVTVLSNAAVVATKSQNGCDPTFVFYPNNASTKDGGLINYKVVIQNQGNVAARDLTLLDIFPFIGDNRGSQWFANLVGPIINTDPNTTIFYTTTNNACYSTDLVGAFNPPSCNTPVWSTTAPVDITSVKGIKINRVAVLGVLDSIVISWPMRVPVGTPSNITMNNTTYYQVSRNDIAGTAGRLTAASPNQVGMITNCAPLLGTIGNYVWYDADTNGIQNEPAANGINGVKIYLYGAGLNNIIGGGDDILLDSTISGNDFFGKPGYYKFVDVPSGIYYVNFQPNYSNFTQTPIVNQTNQTDLNNDAQVGTGNSGLITINAAGTGQDKDNTTIDAGYYIQGSLGNYVWYDDNNNGLQDEAASNGINGVIVNLLKDNGTGSYIQVATTTTANDGLGNPGYYNFPNLLGGNYKVQFPTSVGNYPVSGTTTQTAKVNGNNDANSTTGLSGVAVLTPILGGLDKDNPTIDAGYRTNIGSLGNYVWFDTNGDGIQNEPSSNGINGVTVNLLKDNGTGTFVQFVTATTANDGSGNPGYYNFTNLLSGNYKVQFPTITNTFGLTNTNQTIKTDNNSDADALTGLSEIVVINTASLTALDINNPTIDAGYLPIGSLGNYVWYDDNINGLQDELANRGINGVTVNLLKDNGTGTFVQVATTITADSNGNPGYYNFPNLIYGIYKVQFPTSFGNNALTSTFNQAAQTNGNNDADGTGLSGNVVINPLLNGLNRNNPTIDAGYATNIGSIGNYVWIDTNGNGIQDEAAANGINGVVVNLLKDNGTGTFVQVATTITADSNGNSGYYNFSNLTIGNYKVEFPTNVNNKTLTISNQVSQTNGNSDANASTGLSGIITISIPSVNPLDVNNPTIDAGYLCNLSVSLTAVSGTCSNNNLASIATTITGGVASSYLWSNNATTSSINNISVAGIYSVTVSDNFGCVATGNATVSITPCCNVTSGGTINGAQTNCGPFDPSIIGSSALPSGGVGTIEYVWLFNLNNVPNNNGSNGWVLIPGANGSTYDPGVITQTTYYLRCARRTGCTAYVGETNIIAMIVNTIPNANFTINNPIQCSINNFEFTNTSSDNLVNNWNFGDNTIATTLDATKSYTTLGYFDVKLLITNSLGCQDSIIKQVFVGNPSASFTYSKNCKNEVTFTNTSTNATDYEWIIGDKTICNTSSIPNQILHSDNASSGTSYLVTLIAKNNSLCYDTFTQMITIYPPAITVFSANPIGCTTNVKFNNFTMFGSSYSWDFGVVGLTTDTSTQTNPTYTYPSNGNYTVRLIANNTEGCGDTLSIPVLVNSNGISPTASFNINEISTACAKRYSFTNTSTNAVSYQWIFDDGSIVNTVNASKSFAYAGTYAVKLVAQSSTGCFDTIIQNVNVLSNSVATVASFGVNNRSQCLANNSFEFYNTSVFVGSGWIPNYHWDFGDGTYNNINSSVFNKHYSTPGIYTVRVIAIGSNGCRDTAYQTIEVLPSPVAAFTASTSCGMTALINNQTTGAISNIWNFGTGYFEENNASTFSNTYHHEDWYFINLTAIGANGCTDRTDRGVFPTRVGAPAPNFTYDTLGCSHAIRFTNTSIGGASASWDFGDGSPLNTNFDPTHIYAVAGNYTVTLTLSNGPFCSASYSMLVHAPQGYNVATPKAGMTLNISACTNTINATDTSLNTFIRNWYFDGVLVGVLPSLTITNPTVGGHELKLTVSNGVCFDTLKKFVLIQAAPISVVTHQISSCSRTVLFSSEATNGNTYSWNFNDAGSLQNTSAGSLVSHTFSTNGTYYVTLTSTNLSGCSTSTTDTVVVNAGNNPLNAAFKFNSNTCNCVCNNKIQFTNLSSGIGNTYLWNFGDGTSTTQTNPNKGFAEAGTYNVTLTAVSPSGCISVASMQVNILPSAKGPSASFNTDNQIQCLSGNNFSFYNTSKHMGSGWNMKYYWDFGDGTTDTMNTFVFNKHYNAVGIYTVSLVALGSDNCFDTMTMTVQVKSNNCMSYSNNVQIFNQSQNGSSILNSNNSNTGVNEKIVATNNWSLYPNPNKGTFSIACNKLSNNVEVEVIDILGRKVNATFTKNYNENKIEISCNNISTGYYFVIINNGKDGENTRLKFNITE